jgi:hypothetical protein
MVAAFKNPTFSEAKQVERTTSVKMRKIYIGETGSAYFKDVIKFINPEIKLCRDLHQDNLPINVQWSVNHLGKVSSVIVQRLNKEQSYQFSECVQAVVEHFDYPLLTNNTSFAHQF